MKKRSLVLHLLLGLGEAREPLSRGKECGKRYLGRKCVLRPPNLKGLENFGRENVYLTHSCSSVDDGRKERRMHMAMGVLYLQSPNEGMS